MNLNDCMAEGSYQQLVLIVTALRLFHCILLFRFLNCNSTNNVMILFQPNVTGSTNGWLCKHCDEKKSWPKKTDIVDAQPPKPPKLPPLPTSVRELPYKVRFIFTLKKLLAYFSCYVFLRITGLTQVGEKLLLFQKHNNS